MRNGRSAGKLRTDAPQLGRAPIRLHVISAAGTIAQMPHLPDMPRYFFNLRHLHAGIDDQGEELRDDEAAWQEATKVAGEIFKDVDGKFRPGQEWSLEVMDESHEPVYRIVIRGEKLR